MSACGFSLRSLSTDRRVDISFAQVLWLSTAYRLEFEGKPVFLELWGASIIFFLVNVFILWQLLGMPHAL